METKKPVALDFTKDEYWGKGGRYVVNPATGKREPAPVIDDAATAAVETAPASLADPNAAAGADNVKPLKERNRG